METFGPWTQGWADEEQAVGTMARVVAGAGPGAQLRVDVAEVLAASQGVAAGEQTWRWLEEATVLKSYFEGNHGDSVTVLPARGPWAGRALTWAQGEHSRWRGGYVLSAPFAAWLEEELVHNSLV